MKTRTEPMRRCIGCMESKPKSDLVRISSYEGKVELDPSGKAKGRGLYLCPREECLAKARKKKALQRTLKENISEEDMNRLFDDLNRYASAKDNHFEKE